MSDSALYHAALAVAVGMAAQAVAVRFALPGIVLLLAAGVAIGPDVLGLLQPDVFGAAHTDLVSLAVTVILFEGGLGLRLEDLRQQQRSLILLLTVGGLISMVTGMLAARYGLGMLWYTAALYGALMIVTGPTVVTPLLSRLTVDRSVRELLIGEGVLIDPIGAIVAIVTLEYLIGEHGVLATGWVVLWRLVVGAGLGAGAGLLMTFVLRRRWVREDLWNPVVLASVLMASVTASRISGESGLMAAVTQGVVMANTGLRELRRLRQFNEEMTIVLLSFIFVLLAADLPLSEVAALGWPALGVVAALVWIGRPLAVFICTAGAGMSVRQRLFLSWVCPRGIVAASVAGLFRILLNAAEIPGGNQLEALVFVTVALTVTVQGLTIGPVARALQIDTPSLLGTMIVGADRFGRLLARMLTEQGRQVLLFDRNPRLCRAAHAENLTAYNGDALSVEALEEAGARYVDTVLTVTTNPELNTLVAQRIGDNFRVQRLLAVVDEATRREKELDAYPFPGNFPGPEEVNRQIRGDRLRIAEHAACGDEIAGKRLDALAYGEGEFALCLRRREHLLIASADLLLAAGDVLLAARPAGAPSALAEVLEVEREWPAA